MEERKIVALKKEEFSIREYIKTFLGKGKVSKVRIEYTPVGEKIVVSTNKPGLVIGKKGEKIGELTEVLKKKFKLENPHVEIDEITKPEFDAQLMADDIALSLEKMGPLKFKVIAYRALDRIMKGGALGAEIKLGGKLPSSRAKQWRFSQGYLKKVGDTAKVVDRAQSRAETRPGTVGIKVSILSPNAILTDRVNINEELLAKLRLNSIEPEEENTLIPSRAYPKGTRREGTSPKKSVRKKKSIKKEKIAETKVSEDSEVINSKEVEQNSEGDKKLTAKKISATQGASK